MPSKSLVSLMAPSRPQLLEVGEEVDIANPGVPDRVTPTSTPGSLAAPRSAIMQIVGHHIVRGELAAGAAALLPELDLAAAQDHVPSQMAAILLRAVTLPDTRADTSLALTRDQVLLTMTRLTALLRQKEAQIVQLQAMLENML